MKKLDDRFINFTYGSSNAITAEDIPYDATSTVQAKIATTGSGAEPANPNIQNHIASTSNPHTTTYSQVGAEPANANIQNHIGSTSNPHSVTKSQVNLGSVDNVQQLPLSYLDTDVTLSADSNTKVASQKATKAYADSLIAANGAMVYKGSINCSGNPNYPAASVGHSYKVSVAGKLGGASGINVEVGDLSICLADSTAGTQAQVGANWNIIQVNLDGAVIGPSSSTDHGIARFDLTTGKLIQDSISTINDAGTINIPSGQFFNIDGSPHTHSYEPANANIQSHISDTTSNPHSVTATQVSLGNVTNESKATMFTNPAFTGTPTGITATHVGLGNVTNNAQIKKLATSVDNEILRWDNTTGDTVQASAVTISDTGTINIPISQSYSINGTPHTHAYTSKATGLLSSWTLSSGNYYSNFAHNLGVQPVIVQVFDSTSWTQVIPLDIVLTDTNNCRIWLSDNTTTLSIIVIG